ncbi:hypothetical protein B0T18DRAFT_410798 [Schizothecium vesticola]|uniref:Uncharacterized protein n=1 Tax=Schizothecium vesticola TaxID=314040 RepID=A0AA40K4Y2_9PEZI|nr:hypothetical protein B0T18DRAFT_410798 [Schizothecium vesticola]
MMGRRMRRRQDVMTMRDARWGTRLPCERSPRGIILLVAVVVVGVILFRDSCLPASQGTKGCPPFFPLIFLSIPRTFTYIYIHQSKRT